jgi:hypothetical protein
VAQGDQTVFSKEIQAFAEQAQAFENAAQDVYTLRDVLTATGQTLDYVGDQVGIERPSGMDDNAFRALVQAKIQMNLSGGEPNRLIAAVVALTYATTVNYADYYCMASLEFAGTLINTLYTYIKRLVVGGVALRLVQIDETTPFQFDSEDLGFDQGKLGNLIRS